MDVRFDVLAALMLFWTVTPSAHADPSACKDARESYRTALDQLSRALQDYTQCLKSGRGEDDCAVAFVDVESAQKDIEAAVAKIKDDCRPAD